MTTSNITIYELNRDKIIAAAMRKLGVLAKGQSPDTEDLTNGMQALNAIIAEFQTLGMQLWSREDYTLTLVEDQSIYTIGLTQDVDIAFPLKVLDITLRNSSGGVLNMTSVAKSEFDLLSTQSTGIPNSYTYQPKINYGILSIWPKPDASAVDTYTCEITYQAPLQGFTLSTQTPHFPQEWQQALIYQLAWVLAPEYGKPLPDRNELKEEAKIHLDRALEGGTEEASFFFQVNRRY
jgi:hypothetical protein